MFEPTKRKIVVRDQQLTIQELTAAQVQAIGDSIEELVAASVADPIITVGDPIITVEVVQGWPGQVVLEIANHCNALNGFSEGNASPPPG